MCGICGVYILQKHDLPDIVKALGSIGLNGGRLVSKNSAAAGTLFFLLKYLNNRGHDSSGIVTFDGKERYSYKGMGFAEDVFNQKILEKLVGNIGVGHDRYATTGLPRRENIQPFVLKLEDRINHKKIPMALSHNGNIVNERHLREIITEEEYQKWGTSGITSTTDSELMLHKLALEFYANPTVGLEELVQRGLNDFIGAYSLTIMSGKNLIGVRDPHGFWPLYIAKLGNLVILSSEETPIRKFIEASGYNLKPSDFVRSVKKGDVEIVNTQMVSTHISQLGEKKEMGCSFDYSYVRSHEESGVSRFRETCGRLLWQKFPVKADYVVPVPNSGIFYAKGLSEESEIQYKKLVDLNPKYYSKHRVFQESTEADRLKTAQLKHIFQGPYKSLKIILADDSLIRSTTLRHFVKQLRNRGIAEAHVRIGMPPAVTPCYLGIHMPTRGELIAGSLMEEEVETYFRSIFYGVDYEKNELSSLIKKGIPIEDIISKSVQDKKNFLKDGEMRKAREGEFSLKYIPMESYKEAFELAGLDSHTKCYACQTRGGAGYPMQMRKHLKALGVI